MKRDVLEIPLGEITLHLDKNERKDVKVIAPSILTRELYEQPINRGKKGVKEEIPLEGDHWTHSGKLKPNKLCESTDFDFDSGKSTKGPFAISFANQEAEQEEYYHARHAEIYFSEHPIGGYYRRCGGATQYPVRLDEGGVIIFGPNIIHYMELGGLTIVVEIPSVEGDRFVEKH